MNGPRLASLALLWPLANGCGSGPDIRGKDRDALLSNARIHVDFAPEADESARSQPIRGLEIAVAGVQGNFENSGTGRADFDLVESHVVYRFGVRRRRVELFGFAGVAAMHFDGRTSLGARADEDHLGATAGFQFGVRATDWLVPYARVSVAQYNDYASSLRAETGVEFRPCSGFGMQVGYGYWDHEQDSDSFREPDVDVTTQGLMIGVTMRF